MHRITKFFIASESNNYRPAVLHFRVILVVAMALAIARLFIVSPPALSSAVESNTIMSLINNARSQRNLPTLLTNQPLVQASTLKTQDMIDRDYFAHIDPDGQYIWGKIVAAGYSPYNILGENLAIDFTTSEGMIQAWIDSPTHRQNLLHTDFVHQGLTALYGDYQGRFTNLTTSLFGTLQTATQTPSTPAPPPEPTPQPEVQPPPAPAVEPEPSPAPQPEKLDEPALPPTPPPAPDPSLSDTFPGFPDKSSTNTQSSGRPFSQLSLIRIIFTLFGVGFLLVLTVDSVVIYRHEKRTRRGHPSYHLFIFILLVLVSLLVWWWS